MQGEGLRLWRLAALQGLPVVALDALWPLLAAAFLPPGAPPAAAAAETGGARAPAGSGGEAAGGGDRALAARLAREALLTAAELVCRASRCCSPKP